MLVFLLLPLYAFAEGEGSTYSLPEIGVTLDVPSGYYVFTQQTKEGDPGVSELRINVEKMKQELKEDHIYLSVLPKDLSFQILFIANEDPSLPFNQNINNLSRAEFRYLFDSIALAHKEQGIEYEGRYKVVESSGVKFLMMTTKTYKVQGKDRITVQYYSIYKGKDIRISLHSFANEITPEMESVVKQVVDSIKFNENTPGDVINTILSFFSSRTKLVYGIGAVLALLLILLRVRHCRKKKEENL